MERKQADVVDVQIRAPSFLLASDRQRNRIGRVGQGARTLRSCPMQIPFCPKTEEEVSPELCAEMDRHVDGCPYCKGLCDSLKRTLEVCSSLPTTVVPPHVQESLRRAVREAIQEGAAVRA